MQPDDPISKNYPNTDLNNAFFIDDAAQKCGYFEARKHHEEYQEHLQSKHTKDGLLGCQDCHSPHAVKGKVHRCRRHLQGLPRHDDGLQEDDAGHGADGGRPVRAHALFQPEPAAERPDGGHAAGARVRVHEVARR